MEFDIKDKYSIIEHVFRSRRWMFWKIAYDLTNDKEKANDIVQTAFYRTLKWARNIVSVEHCQAVTIMNTKHAVFNYMKSEQTYEQYKKRFLFGGYIESIQKDNSRKMDYYPLDKKVLKAAERLTEKQQLYVKMAMRGNSDSEIREEMGDIYGGKISDLRRRAIGSLRNLFSSNSAKVGRPKLTREKVLPIDEIKLMIKSGSLRGRKATISPAIEELYLSGKKQHEIAILLGVSERKVNVAISRAIKAGRIMEKVKSEQRKDEFEDRVRKVVDLSKSLAAKQISEVTNIPLKTVYRIIDNNKECIA